MIFDIKDWQMHYYHMTIIYLLKLFVSMKAEVLIGCTLLLKAYECDTSNLKAPKSIGT